jgi:hypothetical protein
LGKAAGHAAIGTQDMLSASSYNLLLTQSGFRELGLQLMAK